ncbi:hypothetical protein D3C80_1119740 [compost metagenome]
MGFPLPVHFVHSLFIWVPPSHLVVASEPEERTCISCSLQFDDRVLDRYERRSPSLGGWHCIYSLGNLAMETVRHRVSLCRAYDYRVSHLSVVDGLRWQ